MVVLLISLVLVLVAIVVVVRLLLAELARTAAYRQQDSRASAPAVSSTVQPNPAKVGVSATMVGAGVAVGPTPAAPPTSPPVSASPLPETAVPTSPADLARAPRRRDVERAVRAPWWQRLRSGTALILLVAVLGAAAAGIIGAIALFLAFVFDQALR